MVLKASFIASKVTMNLYLFYPYEPQNRSYPFGLQNEACLVGYADARYFSNLQNAPSQWGYVFTVGTTTIFWRSNKQTLVATSSNRTKIPILHLFFLSLLHCNPLSPSVKFTTTTMLPIGYLVLRSNDILL